MYLGDQMVSDLQKSQSLQPENPKQNTSEKIGGYFRYTGQLIKKGLVFAGGVAGKGIAKSKKFHNES